MRSANYEPTADASIELLRCRWKQREATESASMTVMRSFDAKVADLAQKGFLKIELEGADGAPCFCEDASQVIDDLENGKDVLGIRWWGQSTKGGANRYLETLQRSPQAVAALEREAARGGFPRRFYIQPFAEIFAKIPERGSTDTPAAQEACKCDGKGAPAALSPKAVAAINAPASRLFLGAPLLKPVESSMAV